MLGSRKRIQSGSQGTKLQQQKCNNSYRCININHNTGNAVHCGCRPHILFSLFLFFTVCVCVCVCVYCYSAANSICILANVLICACAFVYSVHYSLCCSCWFVSRTERQLFTCDLVSCVWSRCGWILKVWFTLKWPCAVDKTLKSKN